MGAPSYRPGTPPIRWEAAARARLVSAPEYGINLDEPMGQLEPPLRAVVRGRIKSLLAERGMTVIFVTHDQTDASALANRIAVMEDGVLQHRSLPSGLQWRAARPQHPDAAMAGRADGARLCRFAA